jgi:hypothetical protein
MCLKFFQKLLGVGIDVEQDSDFELVYIKRKAPAHKRYTEADYKKLESQYYNEKSMELDLEQLEEEGYELRSDPRSDKHR